MALASKLKKLHVVEVIRQKKFLFSRIILVEMNIEIPSQNALKRIEDVGTSEGTFPIETVLLSYSTVV